MLFKSPIYYACQIANTTVVNFQRTNVFKKYTCKPINFNIKRTLKLETAANLNQTTIESPPIEPTMNGPRKRQNQDVNCMVLTRQRSQRTIRQFGATNQITEINKQGSTKPYFHASKIKRIKNQNLSFGQSLDLQTPSYTYQPLMDIDNDNSPPQPMKNPE